MLMNLQFARQFTHLGSILTALVLSAN